MIMMRKHGRLLHFVTALAIGSLLFSSAGSSVQAAPQRLANGVANANPECILFSLAPLVFNNQSKRVLVLVQGLGTSAAGIADQYIVWHNLTVAGITSNYKGIVYFSYNANDANSYSADQTHHGVYSGTYSNVTLLHDLLENCLALYGSAIESFDLIGHSQGGVIANEYIKKYGFDPVERAANSVSHIIALDSPVNGLERAWCLNYGIKDLIQCLSPDQLVLPALVALFQNHVWLTASGFDMGNMFRNREKWMAENAQAALRLDCRSQAVVDSKNARVRYLTNVRDIAVLPKDAILYNSDSLGSIGIPFDYGLNSTFSFEGDGGHHTIYRHPTPYVLDTLITILQEYPVNPTNIGCSDPNPSPTPIPPSPPPSVTPDAVQDSAAFLSDLTFPDGSSVSPSQVFVKTWRLRNTGSSTWGAGYQLAFVSGEQMSAPNAVSVPSTAPNATADISVNLTAPTSGGNHVGYWQMRNPQGTYFGPKIWVQIKVPGGADPTPPPPGLTWSDIEFVSADYPSVVVPGQSFRPKITVKVISGQLLQSRGDYLQNTDQNLYGAHLLVQVVDTVNAGQNYTFEFYPNNPIVAPSAEGTYTSKWRVWRNGTWAGPEITIRFDVRNDGGTRPNPPTLSSPGEWSVFLGTTPQLCVSAMNGVQYWFQIFESAQNADSNWTNSNCWTPAALGPYGYQWHVKVKDAATNIESEWSTTRHFNIESATPSVSDIRFNPGSPSAVDTVRFYACAVDQYEMYVNTATDGSTSGQWWMITNALPRGCDPNNSANWIDWSTLRFEDGLHRIRLQVFKNGVNGGRIFEDWTHQLNRRRPNQPETFSPSTDLWLNTQTVTFRWNPPARTQTLNLIVATDSNHTNQILNQTLGASTTSFTTTFSQAYANLYWFIGASNEIGAGAYTGTHFGIDLVAPASSVSALPAVSYDTAFQVSWSASDATSGVRWYDIQLRDASHPSGVWSDWVSSSTDISKPYSGNAGHTFCFRSRAMDNAGNWSTYTNNPNGDACTQVNPAAAPPAPWWNNAYGQKRNLLVSNTYTTVLPVDYPVHLHFDTNTPISSADLYAASLSATKGDDFRILYNNATELPRFIQAFRADLIDIWFNLQIPIDPNPGFDNSHYQLYYGASGASNPPGNVNDVFRPPMDANTVGLWHFHDGNGATFVDTSGNGNNGTLTNGSWLAYGRFGSAAIFNGANTYAEIPASNIFDLRSFTIEGWFKFGTSPTQALIWRRMSNNQDNSYYLGTRDRKLEAAIGGRSVWSSTVLDADRWYHIAYTYDGQSLKIYINDQLVTTGSDNQGTPASSGPLVLGRNSANADYLTAQVQGLRISNVARTSFPYGGAGTIGSEPTAVAGASSTPPVQGSPDLNVLNTVVYPNPSGGLLVQSVVQNQGTTNTRNSFFTDLYLNHIPAGSGDFSGSVQFWVNDPIAAGAVVTLTTVITDLSTLYGMVDLPLAAASEVTGTLYAQADTAGVVSDTNKLNNIDSSGAQFCIATPDVYEGDETAGTAQPITLGQTQTHNFTSQSDSDWATFTAQGGITYTLSTSNLGPSADTYLYLYDTDGVTLLASNDDYNGGLASQIDWTAPLTGTYYVLARSWNPNVSGCGTSYNLNVAQRVGPYRVFLPLTANNSIPGTVHWTAQTIDASKLFVGMNEHALRLDANSYPHIAYGGDQLYYARYDGAVWHTEIVDSSPGVGAHASLALDSAGHAHISYYDTVNSRLKYAHWTGSAWDIQVVETNVWVLGTGATSIDVDGNDRPAIAYILGDFSGYDLHCARWNGVSWQIQTVETDSGLPSLKFDGAGSFHIVYPVVHGGKLKYASWTGSTWVSQTITSGYLGGDSLAFDAGGNPCASFLENNYPNSSLKYTCWTGSAWISETVITGGWFQASSITFGTDGNPRIAYVSADSSTGAMDYKVRLARWTGTAWDTQVVESQSPYTDGFVSLALDQNNNPHLSYANSIDIRYAQWLGGGWVTQTIDIGSGTGSGSNSLALDSTDLPTIAYSMGGTIKSAHWNGNTWDIQTPFTATVACCVAMAIDQADHLQITYSGRDPLSQYIDSVLWHSRWNGSTWQTDELARSEVGTGYSALALDHAGNAHLSYMDGGATVYDHWNGSAWQRQIMGQGGWTSIALDSADRPFMVWSSYPQAQYAHWTGSSWVTSSLGVNASVPNIVVDVNDMPHVSYNDNSLGALVYARWVGSVWVTETVASNVATFENTQIALDLSGTPCITYVAHESGQYVLKLARRGNTGWVAEVIMPVSYWGPDQSIRHSLAIDALNRAHVSLYESLTSDLKYAVRDNPFALPPVGPDLVGSIALSPANPTGGQSALITVIITNTGTASASAFWVDFYINPTSPPTQSNQSWDSRCGLTPCYGLSWFVNQPLAPGQSVTLTSDPSSYSADYTRWPGYFAAGTSDLYMYVDSWSEAGLTTGAVAESSESNNRTEIHFAPPLSGPATAAPGLSPGEALPSRARLIEPD